MLTIIYNPNYDLIVEDSINPANYSKVINNWMSAARWIFDYLTSEQHTDLIMGYGCKVSGKQEQKIKQIIEKRFSGVI